MKIILNTSILLLGFGLSPQTLLALPSPSELNLAVPVKIPVRILSPLIHPAYMVRIEGEACESIQNGADPGFIKAEIYRKIIAQPTRTYRYGEAWRLTNYIYNQVKCVAIANK